MEPISDPRADITTGYLLVDVSNLPELDCEPLNMVACVPPALTNFQELMPCLVAVDGMSLTQREQLIKMLEYQRAGEHAYAICAWLDCDLDIEELAVHIAGFLSGPGPEGLGGSKVLIMRTAITFATISSIQMARYWAASPLAGSGMDWTA